MRNVSEHRYIYPSVLHVARGWSVTIEKPFQVIYTVFHKKRGSTFVIITLETLDGF